MTLTLPMLNRQP